jgi:hygromycin-B 4-O-kinase
MVSIGMMQRLADEAAWLRALLRAQFATDVQDVVPLFGGEFSRAFAFTANGQSYVIRLNPFDHAVEAFTKDDYAWRHFASPALPIPRVVAIGQADGLHFAISERVAGHRLEEVPLPERRALLPAVLDIVDAIGRADVSASHGYGAWDLDGNGTAASWHSFLAAVIENWAEGYYQDWHALFRESFLERDVFEVVYRRMLRLVPYCPEARALIHNDLHFDNIMSDGRRITGVVDWANALYGDALYDVAWLDWWFAKSDDQEAIALLHARHRAAPHFRERIACYTCYIGLDDLRFYAKTERQEQYERARDRLLALIAGEVDET